MYVHGMDAHVCVQTWLYRHRCGYVGMCVWVYAAGLVGVRCGLCMHMCMGMCIPGPVCGVCV